MARIAQQTRKLYEMCAVAVVEGRGDLDGASDVGFDVDFPVFAVSTAARLAAVHPQTLRQYDRLGLVVPQRTEGGARRYSLRDIDRLAQAQWLSQDEGVNLTGITRILTLEEENRELREEIHRLHTDHPTSIFEASIDGHIVKMQHSHRARLWQRLVRANPLALPSAATVAAQAAVDVMAADADDTSDASDESNLQ